MRPTPPEVVYHEHSHRLYRALRGRPARDLSPLSPTFAEQLAAAYKEAVEEFQLRPPEAPEP